ncbi:hypothetical protein [Streptomyces sp. NPDC006307]|uniref:hypothetical protein n=1 Tax=Streptomyces sp. NPDC006307 TaxID=3156748 RepID=UPI0033B3C22A
MLGLHYSAVREKLIIELRLLLVGNALAVHQPPEMVDCFPCFGDQRFGALVPFQCREARQLRNLCHHPK